MVEGLKTKTKSLITQQGKALDYIQEIESMLENWQIQDEGLTHLTVIDNVEEYEQEWHVQEVLIIDKSISKLVLFIEKIELMLEKNERIVNKQLIRIRQDSLSKASVNLNNQLEAQKDKALKIKNSLKMMKSALSLQNQVNKTFTKNNQDAQTQKQNIQPRLNQLSLYLSNLDSILNTMDSHKI